jgi:toluene monooxygenase system protein E
MGLNIEQGGMKTWSALAGTKKRPSEYEVVTYKLHTRTRDPDVAYEQSPDSAMNEWYRQNVRNSPLRHPDWDAFRDPDQITYRAYTTMQDGQEEYVDGLIAGHANGGHDASLPPSWVQTLARAYTPLRYLLTTLQMGSAYVVQMAPASTITNCAAFQEADALRWVSRVAYRTRQLANQFPDQQFGKSERQSWEDAEAWQGFRELLEKMLTTYEWAENLFVLNVVAARAVDEACLRQLARAARSSGDTLTAMLCEAQLHDSERSRRWTAEWVKMAAGQEGNLAVMQGWLAKWGPLAERAIDQYCTQFDIADAGATARNAMQQYVRQLGLIA